MSNSAEILQQANRGLQERDWEAFADAHTDDVWVFGAGVVDARGREGLRTVFDMWVEPFPDLFQRPVDMLASDDQLFVQIEIEGTHKGDLQAPDGSVFKPTHRRFKTRMAAHFKIRDGKIGEVFEFINFADIYRQLGIEFVAGEAKP